VGGRGSPDRALAQRSSRSAGGHVGVEHLKGAERRDDTLGVAGPTPEHDRGCCLAAPARWRTPQLGSVPIRYRGRRRVW